MSQYVKLNGAISDMEHYVNIYLNRVSIGLYLFKKILYKFIVTQIEFLQVYYYLIGVYYLNIVSISL